MRSVFAIIGRRSGARGHTDLSIVFWILLILVLIAAGPALKQMGIEPADLWRRVPEIWKLLLAAAAALIAVGIAVAFAAGYAADHREPYGVEPQRDRCVIRESALLERALGVMLLAGGLVFLGFGVAGGGWFSWLVLALGVVLALLSTPGVSGGRRYVIARGRLASESRLFWAWSEEWSRTWDPGTRPRLEIKKGGLSGGWGRYELIPDAVLVNGEELAGSTRDARKLLPLLQQAIDDTHA